MQPSLCPRLFTRTPAAALAQHRSSLRARALASKTMASPAPLSGIPTLTLLYKLKKITPPTDTAPLHPPNAALNDKISIIRQDITTLALGAIVNAANTSLLGGGGVDGAIHRAAGPGLVEECETLDGCATGGAKITNGYELPAEKVIHAVGPIYWQAKKGDDKTPAALLSGCYRKSLELCVEHGIKSVAFSALSTGVYGYPSGEASEVALETVRKFLEEQEQKSVDKEENKSEEQGVLERVVFCNFLQKDEDAYFGNVGKYFPPETESDHQKEDDGNAEAIASKLPDAPKTDPAATPDPEAPSAKKQKTEATPDDDFVVVDKPDPKV